MAKPSTYTAADNLANEVPSFYASLIGKTDNTYLVEFSFLVEWMEAAQAASAEALNLRDWIGVDYYDAMADEAAMHLDLTNEREARKPALAA